MKPADYNDDELKNLAPKLSSIEKKEGFTVPGNYFDSLPNQIMDKIAADPLLKEAAETNPFAVPEGYFEGLPLDIISRIEAAEAKRFSPGILFKRVLRPQFSLSLVTACFVLFICVRFFEKPIVLNSSQMSADNVSITESDVLDEVDESTLISEVTQESTSVNKNNKATKGDKSIEDYIINNNVDLSDIAKEL